MEYCLLVELFKGGFTDLCVGKLFCPESKSNILKFAVRRYLWINTTVDKMLSSFVIRVEINATITVYRHVEFTCEPQQI